MKKIVRVRGNNGVIYEERMTEAQLQQFLTLVALGNSMGRVLREWTLEVADDDDNKEQRLKTRSMIFCPYRSETNGFCGEQV